MYIDNNLLKNQLVDLFMIYNPNILLFILRFDTDIYIIKSKLLFNHNLWLGIIWIIVSLNVSIKQKKEVYFVYWLVRTYVLMLVENIGLIPGMANKFFSWR